MAGRRRKPKALPELDTTYPWKNPIYEDAIIAIYKDKYPVSKGHLLFVPKEDTPRFVQIALDQAYQYGCRAVQNGEYDGFNIGLNHGSAAGQTIAWSHVHLIPRRVGDVENPEGGVRWVIPEKAKYREVKGYSKKQQHDDEVNNDDQHSQ